MSSTLEWLTQNVDFFFWMDSVFALRDTKSALRRYLQETVESHLNKEWSSEERSLLKTFIKHNAGDKSELRGKSRCAKTKCCELIWKKLVENHTGETPKTQTLFIDKITEYRECDEWWTFLKFFLLKGNVRSFEECDASAICKILRRCKLFREIDTDKLTKLEYRRNKLMHSSTNEISAADKCEYIDDMIEFLETEPLQHRDEIKKFVQQLKEDKQKSRISRNKTQLEDFDDVQRALNIQRQAIEEDLKYFRSRNIKIPGLEEIITLTVASLSVCKAISRNLRELASLDEVTALGGEKGKKEVGPLGFLPGCAAANVVGKIKQLKQPTDIPTTNN